MSTEPVVDYKAEIERHFAWLQTRLPTGPSKFVGWLRQPSSKLVRIPLAILLMLGGVFSILPVLGLWMLPLGLLLIAQDVPLLEKPVAQILGWVERKWIERERNKQTEKERLKNIGGPNG
ncbi:hypothetical protein [Tardiphaga sp.]|uniref:hypothetical protein n=1 Tax=Tardiphaga sp. TaxID=1926292 RepID=UPI0026295646|nr:hypothetical protein [Tardiphaga sp.]MDB5618818.1 hypothetical protein [Tardiphaga sp.]